MPGACVQRAARLGMRLSLMEIEQAPGQPCQGQHQNDGHSVAHRQQQGAQSDQDPTPS